MNDTAFDPERFKLPPEMAAELAKAKLKHKGKQPKRTEPFVQVPCRVIAKAVETLSTAQDLAILLHILHRAWAEKSNRVKLTSAALGALGITRWAKHRALRRLEEAGFVSVERRQRQNPIVTLRPW